MKAIIQFCFTIILLAVHQDGFSQLYEEGQYAMISSDPNEVYGYYKPNKSYHVIFTKDKMAKVYFANDTIVSRTVYDYANSLVFEFSAEFGKPSYTKSELTDRSIYQIQTDSYKSFYNVTSIDTNEVFVKGLPCQEWLLTSRKYGQRKCYVTSALKIPEAPSPKPSLFNNMVVIKDISLNPDMHGNAIDIFYPYLKNPEWLSTSVEGYSTLNSIYREKEALHLKNLEESAQPLSPDLQIAKNLYKADIIDEFSYRYSLENTHSRDIFYLMRSSFPKADTLSYDSMLNGWKDAGALSNELYDDLLSLQFDRSSVKEEVFRGVVNAFILKELISNEETRKTIVINSKKAGYIYDQDKKDPGEDFIAGKINLVEYLFAFDIISPMPPLPSVNRKAEVQQFFQQVLTTWLPELQNPIDVNLDDKLTVAEVVINDETYLCPLIYLYDDEGNKIQVDKHYKFSLDANIIEKLLPTVKQIAADHGIKKSFHLGRFSQRFFSGGYGALFMDIVDELYPEQSVFANTYYLCAIPHDRFFVMDDISFFPDINHTGLNDFNNGASDRHYDYMSSKRKNQFVDFVARYRSQLGLSKTDFDELVTNLKSSLLAADADLLGYLPGFTFLVNKDYFHENPVIIESGSSFKSSFPAEYGFIDGDFDLVKMEPMKNGNELTGYDKDGNVHIIPLKSGSISESIFGYVHRYMRPHQKGIYYAAGLKLSSNTYYYLTDSQKEELQEILQIVFVPIVR